MTQNLKKNTLQLSNLNGIFLNFVALSEYFDFTFEEEKLCFRADEFGMGGRRV